MAICICFSLDCAAPNGYRPIRYCATCHDVKHKQGPGVDHIYHLTVENIWDCQPDMQNYLVEAIVR